MNNEKIKNLRKLIAKNTNKDAVFVVEGYHLVNEALKNNLVSEIYELEGNDRYINAIEVSDNVLKSITKTNNPEGVVALCIKKLNAEKGNKIVFLDNVQDPGNVGTIIRTALAFGFDTIFSNINFYNDKIVRSTQGALFNINLLNYENNYKTVDLLKSEGYKIFATSLEKDSIPYDIVNYPDDKIVVIMGNEGIGINKELYKLADQKIYIPIQFESLNVGVATGIILNHIYSLGDKNER
ncbi:RNA methyltransferase [Mycoplasmopsis felifaucium]|uniref:RNA methyltransferase n=1 Tax=Mycoplasmopsis felifaucium TaxID=35768 RepID=A0ABZ2RSD8_9BACT|nr:RNA methyltransferase [Mycoplasmopsis felifaucium]